MKIRSKLLALGLIITSIFFAGVNTAAASSLKVTSSKVNKSTAQSGINIGTVVSSSLFVRSGPGTNFKVIGGLKNSDKVTIINSQAGWYKINFGNTTGFVASNHINTNYHASGEHQIGYITASALNMRSGPGTSHSLMKVLLKGESVVVLEKQQEWVKVNSSNLTGWVLAAYVSSSEPVVNDTVINKKTIVIDAGHGGYDPGAIGSSGTQEKNITLSVSLKLGEILKNQGHTVIYTRESDKVSWKSNVKEDLKARVDIASNSKADLFISIHCNSSKLSYLRGMETYYFGNSRNKLLAKAIQDSMVKDVKLTNRGIREDNFYVIKYNTSVSALVELGYISNPTEEKLLKDGIYQDKWANAIAKGINNYISSN